MLSCGRVKTELFENANIKPSVYNASEHALGSLGITRGYFGYPFSDFEYHSVIMWRVEGIISKTLLVWTRVFEVAMRFQKYSVLSHSYNPMLSHSLFSLFFTQDNLFEWHFTVRGPPDTDFADGRYHGRIILPAEYPMKPPSIMLHTVSGDFLKFDEVEQGGFVSFVFRKEPPRGGGNYHKFRYARCHFSGTFFQAENTFWECHFW